MTETGWQLFSYSFSKQNENAQLLVIVIYFEISRIEITYHIKHYDCFWF